jgi:hypothetical protein
VLSPAENPGTIALSSSRRGKISVNRRLIRRLSTGDTVQAPAIVYYELRRELLRAGKTSDLAPFDARSQISGPARRC